MTHVQYRETLRPRIWVWLMPAAFAACLGVAYGYAYGTSAGWLVGVATAALLLGWLALATNTRIEVDGRQLRAGRATLPLRCVGRVRALDARSTFEARTVRADASAYLLLRQWASSRSVVVEVVDADDPHPYWLLSTRRPEELAQALTTARDAACTG